MSPVLAELDGRPEAPLWRPVHRGDMASIFDDSLHYIRNGDGVEELYNFRRDREELDDLSRSPDHQPDLERLRATLDSILQ